jgi:hypothetical protein
MSDYLIRATYPNVSGMAADEFVNSFAFHAPVSNATAVAAVKSFYDDTAAGGTGTPLHHWLGGLVSRTTPGIIQCYDITGHLDGSPHGSPILTVPLALPDAVPAQSLPEQLAVVISYHADYAGAIEAGPAGPIPTDDFAQDEGAPATHTGRTRPRGSLRGRIFFGPVGVLSINALGSASADIVATTQAAAHTLMSTGLGWAVWSRRTSSMHNIVGGWVDNELGVVRGRREKAQSKTPWTGAP